jgi:hypothetical protein
MKLNEEDSVEVSQSDDRKSVKLDVQQWTCYGAHLLLTPAQAVELARELSEAAVDLIRQPADSPRSSIG